MIHSHRNRSPKDQAKDLFTGVAVAVGLLTPGHAIANSELIHNEISPALRQSSKQTKADSLTQAELEQIVSTSVRTLSGYKATAEHARYLQTHKPKLVSSLSESVVDNAIVWANSQGVIEVDSTALNQVYRHIRSLGGSKEDSVAHISRKLSEPLVSETRYCLMNGELKRLGIPGDARAVKETAERGLNDQYSINYEESRRDTKRQRSNFDDKIGYRSLESLLSVAKSGDPDHSSPESLKTVDISGNITQAEAILRIKEGLTQLDAEQKEKANEAKVIARSNAKPDDIELRVERKRVAELPSVKQLEWNKKQLQALLATIKGPEQTEFRSFFNVHALRRAVEVASHNSSLRIGQHLEPFGDREIEFGGLSSLSLLKHRRELKDPSTPSSTDYKERYLTKLSSLKGRLGFLTYKFATVFYRT